VAVACLSASLIGKTYDVADKFVLPLRIRVDTLNRVTEILIRDVPDGVVAALDANAQRLGITRAEYLRRVLAAQEGPAVTREQLNQFAERTSDLSVPEVMAAASR
jgi:hypothetical protein